MTITYTQGDLLTADVDALVNTVNELGVMGKGIALQFRDRFPLSANEYQRAAKAGMVRVGKVFVTENTGLIKPHWILHFPTKKHWRNPSRMEWVQQGLVDLVSVIRKQGLRSIAIPPLGSGNGGLEWKLVKAEIEKALGDIDDVNVIVYEPSETYIGAPKTSGVEALTIPRALTIELVRRYSVLGFECTMLEIQKLAWFLVRVIDRLGLKNEFRLDFEPNKYGPYAAKLPHLLNALDGSYLHGEKRITDSTPIDRIWAEPDKQEIVVEYVRTTADGQYTKALEQTAAIIEGFESPFGMELLATVDWLLFRQNVQPTVVALRTSLQAWPVSALAAQRKTELFDDRVVALALERLQRTLPSPLT